jgi:galactokinase
VTDEPDEAPEVVAFAPGRVNLIGDHTDYSGGRAIPMAIQLGTTVRGRRGGDAVRLASSSEVEAASVSIYVTTGDLSGLSPAWARYIGGVVHELRPSVGFTGTVTSTLPIAGGLSSSAALELAVALALGFEGRADELAALGQRAEQVACGVPCGIMDQLASAEGIDRHALLIDFTTLAVEPVPMPLDAAVVVVDSGQPRQLVDSAYARRRADCERAAAVIGPLAQASLGDVDGLDDEGLRRRARHVVTENARVDAFAAALRSGDLVTAGELMVASHRSLGGDFDVSTDVLDRVVARLVATPGVFGARLTGAGFGGCVVALAEPGTLDEGWTVTASAGARLLDS